MNIAPPVLVFYHSFYGKGDVMAKHDPGFLSAGDVGGTALRDISESADKPAGEHDQLARDLAEIERAAAALRRAEPALESWVSPPALTLAKPRPVWLLIGLLWLSTALFTVGAVVAIHALVG